MKLAIIGGRDFSDYSLLCNVAGKFFDNDGDIDLIVSGGAKGADSLGARYANANRIPLLEYKPDWEKHGKAAGMIRNKDIINEADVVLAFWDGVSKGTANSLGLAKRSKKPTMIIYY